MTDPEAALTGCLLGQALGDALGFVVEAQPPSVAGEYVKDLRAGRAGRQSHPEYPFGQYSDDTQLARELLSSFVEAGGWRPEVFAGRLGALFSQGRDVGAGPGTRGAAMRLSDGAHWSDAGTPAPYAGNGSAMRAAPLGLLFGDDTRSMVAAAIEQSSITHRDPRCSAGALVVAGATRLAAKGTP
ncbi:MAG: ADP-ribosylglycohydrolase family protein, partial [Gemmatimonadales bacterium]|nr:ADP-ribosylglycohydrolase family protein [Gemmatimonadales bacterium]